MRLALKPPAWSSHADNPYFQDIDLDRVLPVRHQRVTAALRLLVQYQPAERPVIDRHDEYGNVWLRRRVCNVGRHYYTLLQWWRIHGLMP